MQAPRGARITLDGKDRGTQRTFTFKSMPKGKIDTVTIVVELPDGRRIEKKLLLKGGWHVVAIDLAPNSEFTEGLTGASF